MRNVFWKNIRNNMNMQKTDNSKKQKSDSGSIWNPWHGCHKISPGCQNCYVYRRDESIGKDASIVTKTGDFYLPLKKNRQKEYKLQPQNGSVFTCMTSDFFLEEADEWRPECWRIQWILDTRDQCIKYHVPFHFKQTGTFFVMNGKTYHIKRWLQQSQAAKAGIDYDGGKE